MICVAPQRIRANADALTPLSLPSPDNHQGLAMLPLTAALLLLTACTSPPPTETAAPVPAVTGPHGKPQPRRSHRTSRSEQRPAGRVLEVTVYCYTGSRNAAGHWPTVGTAAANAYPLGTRLHVAGIGDVVVEDRSAPGATDVDLYGGGDAGCEARAIRFGRQQLLVTEVNAA